MKAIAGPLLLAALVVACTLEVLQADKQ